MTKEGKVEEETREDVDKTTETADKATEAEDEIPEGEDDGITYGDPMDDGKNVSQVVYVDGEAAGIVAYTRRGLSHDEYFVMIVPWEVGSKIAKLKVEEGVDGESILKFESVEDMADFWRYYHRMINADFALAQEQNRLVAVGEAQDSEANQIVESMKSHASDVDIIEISDDTWKPIINTPIGEIKMGENQRTKLFVKGREEQYSMLISALENPDIIIEEPDKKRDASHERPYSLFFIKSFLGSDGKKKTHFASMTISKEGYEISISSHILRENGLKAKLKTGKLLYKATALDESTTSSAEQLANEVSGPSSDGKGNTLSSDKQEGTIESSEVSAEEMQNPVADKSTPRVEEDATKSVGEASSAPMPTKQSKAKKGKKNTTSEKSEEQSQRVSNMPDGKRVSRVKIAEFVVGDEVGSPLAGV